MSGQDERCVEHLVVSRLRVECWLSQPWVLHAGRRRLGERWRGLVMWIGEEHLGIISIFVVL